MDAVGHFHGGNRGSNPLGDANKIKVIAPLCGLNFVAGTSVFARLWVGMDTLGRYLDAR